MSRRLSPSMLVALVALCVALAGTGVADPVAREAASLKKRVSKALKLGKRADKNARLALAHEKGIYTKAESDSRFLGKGARAADANLFRGLAPPAFLLRGSTAGGDLTGTFPNPALGAGSVTGTKIAGGAVTSAKIADGAVGSADVADASLRTQDLGILNGTLTPNFAELTAGTCNQVNNTVPAALVTDRVLIGGYTGFTEYDNLTVEGIASNGGVGVKVCNPTTGPIDPPQTTFTYTVIR